MFYFVKQYVKIYNNCVFLCYIIKIKTSTNIKKKLATSNIY